MSHIDIAIRLAVDFSGLAAFFYGVFWFLNNLITKNSLENHLIQELYIAKDQVEPEKRKNSKYMGHSFYNEIVHSDEEVLNVRHLNPEDHYIAQMLCKEELNVTKLIASARMSQAIGHNLIGAHKIRAFKSRSIKK